MNRIDEIIYKETQKAAYEEQCEQGFVHQEQPNEDYFESLNDYFDGTMSIWNRISKVDWRKWKWRNFRVAKCLVDGEINEYAIFADGSRKKIIQTNDKYGKYFEVDNELNTDCKSFLRFSYSGRIKDAVEMIRNGNGDCISSMKFVGRIDNVLYFLDRQIGEELRQKSLEGWKDTKFGWVIECGNKNSFSGYSMLNKKNERITVFDKDRSPMVFDTKESADEYVEYLIERSKYYAKRLVANSASSDHRFR